MSKLSAVAEQGMPLLEMARAAAGAPPREREKEGINIAGVFVTFSKLALTTLVVCTSSLVLAMRYSRNRVTENGHRYISSTAVVTSEVVKLAASTLLYAREAHADGNAISLVGKLHSDLVLNWRDTVMLGAHRPVVDPCIPRL